MFFNDPRRRRMRVKEKLIRSITVLCTFLNAFYRQRVGIRLSLVRSVTTMRIFECVQTACTNTDHPRNTVSEFDLNKTHTKIRFTRAPENSLCLHAETVLVVKGVFRQLYVSVGVTMRKFRKFLISEKNRFCSRCNPS